jgi:hypothetical protein
MRVDTIRGFFAHFTAFTIIVGGMTIIFLSRLDPVDARGPLQLMVAGFIGAAITFLFSAEVASRATYAAASSTAAGAASMPTVVTSSGPPAETTITPAQTTVPPGPPTAIEADGVTVEDGEP